METIERTQVSIFADDVAVSSESNLDHKLV